MDTFYSGRCDLIRDFVRILRLKILLWFEFEKNWIWLHHKQCSFRECKFSPKTVFLVWKKTNHVIIRDTPNNIFVCYDETGNGNTRDISISVQRLYTYTHSYVIRKKGIKIFNGDSHKSLRWLYTVHSIWRLDFN